MARRQPKEVTVYLFLGFLESGKTKFIQETLEDKRFASGEKTAILMCEEGLQEYDPKTFAVKGVVIDPVEDEGELTQERLIALEDRGVERVMVEYNGMWMLNTFFDAMPEGWAIAQIMMFADAGSILSYNQNMRQLTYDKLQYSQMVVFNRFDPKKTDRMDLHKMVRAASRSADIIYEDLDGKTEFDEIEDPLPFDVNAPVVTIEDRDYALFYRDLSENLNGYSNKKVHFKGLVVTDDRRLPKGSFVVGRHVMTCCEADIQYCGMVCVGNDSLPLRTRDWVTVEGTIRLEKNRVYKQVGPVIYLSKLVRCEKPEEELATFY